MSTTSSTRRGGRRILVAVRRLTLATLMLAAPACGGDEIPEMDDGETTFAPDLNVDPSAMRRSETGLLTRDLVDGSGDVATPGNFVTVHYTGWLTDGTQFDTSRGGAPFSFRLGAGEVIPGWDEGVAGMRVGGIRQLVIPSDLGYGPAGAGGVIPPDATLVFDVELLEVE